MGTAADIERFLVSVFAAGDFTYHLTLSVLAFVLIVSVRVTLMFRDHPSWITCGIRFFCGLLPLAICLIAIVFLTFGSWHALGWRPNFTATVIAVSIGLCLGFAAAYALGRSAEPRVVGFLARKTRSAGLDDRLTDIRATDPQKLPRLPVNLRKEFADAIAGDTVYLGQDEAGRAVTIDRQRWKTSHVQIMGPPGTGKGIQAGVTLAQSLLYGDAVIVFDPKDDEWGPSVYMAACRRANVPFVFIDLRQSHPQINPILNASSEEVEEMLYASFGLGRQGSAADFYRLHDRKAARLAASFATESEMTLSKIGSQARSSTDNELMAGAKAFFAELEEVSELKCVQTQAGIDLGERIEEGGCVYIVGSMRNEPIITLQKMLFVRLIQLIERSRDRERHCSIFLDEFKYLLSLPALNALGSIRDKGCNILLAHQSLGDFASCGADLSEAAVRATVLDSTPIKWLYRPADYDTAAWISKQTGEIVVATQTVQAERNLELSESLSASRTVGETTRNLIDVNAVMTLPKSCAVCIGAGFPRLAFAEAIRVEKIAPTIEMAEPAVDSGVDLLTRSVERTVDSDELPCLPDIDWSGDPKEAILLYLYGETWTHIEILEELFPNMTARQIRSVLKELSDGKMVRSAEVTVLETKTADVWGISKQGVGITQERFRIEASGMAFSKRNVNPVSFTHHLDIQRLRISAERNGWTDWRRYGSSFYHKTQIRPDAVATRPDGISAAIEVERTVKSKRRYPKIMASHLHSRKQGRWDVICYLCPDSGLKLRLERIFAGISEVSYFGSNVKITDEHRRLFQFYSYDDDWT